MLNTLTIEDVISIVLKRWWIILIGLILGGAISYTYSSYFMDEIYVSRGSLYVNNKTVNTPNTVTNTNDLTVAQKLVDTYSVILKSDRFLKIIQSETNLPYSYTRLKAMVNMEGVLNTEVLEVKVSANNPEHAKEIAQAILVNAKDEIIRVVEAGSVKIVDDATTPTLPSSPNVKTNTIIGLIIGLCFAVLIIFLIEMLDISVKDEEDLENQYGISVVGSIPNLDEVTFLNSYTNVYTNVEGGADDAEGKEEQ